MLRATTARMTKFELCGCTQNEGTSLLRILKAANDNTGTLKIFGNIVPELCRVFHDRIRTFASLAWYVCFVSIQILFSQTAPVRLGTTSKYPELVTHNSIYVYDFTGAANEMKTITTGNGK